MNRLTFLIPDFCIGCSRPGVILCQACLGKIVVYNPQKCVVCLKPSYLGKNHPQCGKQVLFDGVYSIFRYQPPCTNILKRAKYHHNKRVLEYLLESIPLERLFTMWELKKMYPNLVVTGVPQSKTARRERGFNQTEIIGMFLARLLSLPYITTLLKQKETRRQSSLSDKDRRSNLKNTYSTTDDRLPENPNFLLVDDVITTGATATEAARVLKGKYTKSNVYVVSLLRSR